MTAKSLINPLSLRNMRRTVKENKKTLVVISILHLLGIPMCALMLLVQLWLETMQRNELYYASYVDVTTYMVIGVVCFAGAVLVGLVVSTSVFQELWNKTKVDMLCSLPLTGSQRFFSHYLAGAVIYILPCLIAMLLGWLILGVGSFCIDFPALDMTQGEFVGYLGKYYLTGTVGMFLLMMLYYTTSVLLTVCCGTLFESIYTTLLLNCLVPGTFAAVLAVICDNVNGLSFEYLWQPLGYTSPVGGLIYLLFLISEGELYYSYADFSATQVTDYSIFPAFIRWALVLAVIIAACLAAAWYLYKKRPAESVGKPFVFVVAYYFMLTILTVLILCLLAAGLGGGTLLFAAIVYFIMEVVRKRGFKKFWLSAISFACTVAVTLGLFAAVDATKAFGTVYRIPALSTVSSVNIGFCDMQGPYIELEYTDKDIIRAVQELHEDIVDDMKEYDSTVEEINQAMTEADFRILEYGYSMDGYYDEKGYYVDTEYYDYMENYYRTIDPETLSNEEKLQYFDNAWYENGKYIFDGPYSYADEQELTLTYYTIAGTMVNRTYSINPDQYLRLLDIVYGTELYARMYSEQLYNNLLNWLCEYDPETFESYLPAVGELELTNGMASQKLAFRCSDSLLRRLEEAYYHDLLNIRADNTGGVYAIFQEFYIWNNCTETIAVLEEMGMEPFSVPEKFGFADMENPQFVYTDDYLMNDAPVDIRIYAPEDYRFAAEENRGIARFAPYVREEAQYYEDRFYATNDTSMRMDYPELYELMEVLVQYETAENCYMVVINGEWWKVPEEYSDLAEAVMDNGSGYISRKLFTSTGDIFQYRYGDNQTYTT